jgi:hypothetical protein
MSKWRHLITLFTVTLPAAKDQRGFTKYPNTEKYGEVIKLLYDDLKK